MEKNKNAQAERMVTVATVRDTVEARRIKTELESAGLRCELCSEAAAADQWVKARAGGIKIQVDGTQSRRAIELLTALGKSATASDNKGSGGRDRLKITLPGGPGLRIALAMLALIALAGVLAVLFF